jgi:hypothetical protein
MVNHLATCGLVVSHSAKPSTLVDEFIALCDWPLLTQPTTRTVVEQIELHRPTSLLFWLEALAELKPTSTQISQLRVRGQRPFRIAVAHNLPGEVEHTLRAAGVHTYLTTSGNIHALIEGALRPFIPSVPTPHIRPAPVPEVPVPIRGPTEVRGSAARMRPP